MIRALRLIFDPSGSWEAIKVAQHGVARISAGFLIPMLLAVAGAEVFLLLRLGIESGTVSVNRIHPPLPVVIRFELVQLVLNLLIGYLGAIALQQIGASFHRRHSYRECFATLAYSMTPLLLLRIPAAVPALNGWACYGIGAFLMLSLFYRGIPFIMRPDPSNALGLFVFCSFLLLVATALAHYLAWLVLEEKLLA